MAKYKYSFNKEELERLYNEHGSYSLAGKALGVSKTTFRQQYLKSQHKCASCAVKLGEDCIHTMCEDCLDKNRIDDQPSQKPCSCGELIYRSEGQSNLAWGKKQDCEECLKVKYKVSAKKTYLKFRPRNLENDRNSPRVKAYRDWYRTTPIGKAKKQAHGAKRRALKVSTASPTIDKHIESLLLDKENHQCPYCPFTDKMSVDHIVPLTRGGTHTEDNIELVCLNCNIRKGTKTKEEFIEFLNTLKEYHGT